MAEERNLGVARAPEADEDATKAELQRRMEEARESITQTVTEIKDTVANQYQNVKESVTEALDWREQFRKRPVAWSLGALGVGVVVGYSLGGAVMGDDDDDYDDYPAYDETDVYDRTGASPAKAARATSDYNSYAAQAVEGGAYGSSQYAAATPSPAPLMAASSVEARPSYSSGYEPAAAEAEDDKPGLIDRFKETRAYDRLQEEVSELGNRFMDELSTAARTVVLPALFNKIKEMVGVDLSGKSQPSSVSSARQQPRASVPSTSTQPAAAAPSASSTPVSSSGTPSDTGATSSKFDRLAEPGTPSGPRDEAGNRSSNVGYDDRYEQESKLYAKSENRGFGSKEGGGSGTGSTDS